MFYFNFFIKLITILFTIIFI